MHESLYERFRPFKPYDAVLIVALIVLVVVSGDERSLLFRFILLGGGLIYVLLLDFLQKLVPASPPPWQALTIVALHTAAITLLIQFGGGRYALAFCLVNVGYATIAFGEQAGIAAALLSVLTPLQLRWMAEGDAARVPLPETSMVLLVLLTMVALLTRINHLQQQAILDPVTGLRNHRYFQVRLREEISRSQRQNVPTALLLLDLDNFKKVNDRFGHTVGDQLLRQVAQALVKNARTSDVVCRYGGEELAIILPETAPADAKKAAERFRQAVAKAAQTKLPTVTVSIGVACYPNHADQTDTLIAADTAMYQAKREGKNCVRTAPQSCNHQTSS